MPYDYDSFVGEDGSINIVNRITARFQEKISSEIYKEQEKILSHLNPVTTRRYDDSFLYDIVLASDDSYLGLIRHGFDIINNKVEKYLDGSRYDEIALNGVRIGIAITLLELVKDENRL